jgi:dUTP pyrophosphatase
MMIVKIKKFRENAKVPQKMSELAAGFDLYASEIDREYGFAICKLGIGMTPPAGYKIVFVPRSSLTKTQWVLQNSPTQGDEDYTGEYQLRFRCIPGYIFETEKWVHEPFPYKKGDRIGQMFIEKVIDFTFEEVAELKETTRGEGGFGSTNN